jgi:hypothetical protein
VRGTSGGPFAISAAFVPGRILRRAASSGLLRGSTCVSIALPPLKGLCGPNCSSGIGGGEGRRGELEGDTPVRACVTAAAMADPKASGAIIRATLIYISSLLGWKLPRPLLLLLSRVGELCVRSDCRRCERRHRSQLAGKVKTGKLVHGGASGCASRTA